MKKEFNRIKAEIKFQSVLEYIPKQSDVDFLDYFYGVVTCMYTQKTDYKQALKVLKACQSAFILNMNKSLSEIEIEDCFVQYIKFLNDLPYCYLSEAVDEIIKNQRFFPTIAGIIQETQEVSTKYHNLGINAHNLLQEMQARLLPRDKDNLSVIRKKELNDRTDIEKIYLTFMREYYSELFR